MTYSKNGKKVGRPSKQELAAKKPGGRGKVGRPKGDAAIMNEYKARMLARPDSEEVLNAVYQAALDHEHKHQAAAWKLILDRMLPVRAFESDIKGGAKPTISINISSVGSMEMNQGEAAEGEEEEDTGTATDEVLEGEVVESE